MKRSLLSRRPSPAMLVATVALVSSLTGGAVAATLVTGGDIKNGSITKKDLHKNAVNTKKVKNETLLAKDFAPGQLPAGGPAGPRGPQGPEGPQGVPGQDGADATKRFGFVHEPYIGGQAFSGTSTLEWGRGISGVTDTANDGQTIVTFNSSLANCAVLVTVGEGTPQPSDQIVAYTYARVDVTSDTTVEVTFVRHDGNAADESFMIAAFC